MLGLVLVTWVTAASCDRRPEEPMLERSRPSRSEVSGDSDDKASEAKPAKHAPSRCVVPMSAKPPPKPLPAESCPPDPVFGGLTLDKAKVSFPDAPGAPVIEVELARGPRERQRGLMYRTRLDDDAGMLFDFPGKPRVQSFWMRNTCIPLDMLFITEDGFIAGVQENVPTLNDASRSIPCPVRYVLEVNAGWVRAHGVEPGQLVKLPES